MWQTTVSYIDSTTYNVDTEECDPSTLRWISKQSKDWGPDELKTQVQKYPWKSEEPELEIGVEIPTVESPPQPKSSKEEE